MAGTWFMDRAALEIKAVIANKFDTGISHSIQQKLLLDNVLKKRNTTEKNVRGFSKISYASPCTTVNSAF